LTHQQIDNVEIVADTLAQIHPETLGNLAEVGKSLTTEQLKHLVAAANSVKLEQLMECKEQAVEYGKNA
jgi:hypothetical protein